MKTLRSAEAMQEFDFDTAPHFLLNAAEWRIVAVRQTALVGAARATWASSA